MKKDLSIIANELFPDMENVIYKQLLNRYHPVLKSAGISPEITLEEAIKKYTPFITAVFENKDNWKRGEPFWDGLSIVLNDFEKIFEEFFPIYYTEDGSPCAEIGPYIRECGKEIVTNLIEKIFYDNYTGVEIRSIDYYQLNESTPECIEISLRSAGIAIKGTQP